MVDLDAFAMNYFEALPNEKELHPLLATNVELETPSLGTLKGRDRVLAHLSSRERFAHLDALVFRRIATFDDTAFVAYDSFFLEEPQRTVSFVDRLMVEESAIRHIFTVGEEFQRV
ncbi:MAG: hypothetical protein AAFX94_24415 [Myxococcota bacterium]